MPSHWEPCPGKTITSSGSAPGVAVPRCTAPDGAPSRTPSSSARSSSSESATIATRCVRCARRRPSEYVRSSRLGTSPAAIASRCSASIASRACGSWAEIAATAGRAGAVVRAPASLGALSRITCALVPLMPKELTPASAGPSPGHAAVSRWTTIGAASQSIAGLGVSKWSWAGSVRWRIESAVLIRPATPDADSAWPRLPFTDATRSGASDARPGPITSASAAISTGSPITVPVPWVSTYWTSAGSIPARA